MAKFFKKTVEHEISKALWIFSWIPIVMMLNSQTLLAQRAIIAFDGVEIYSLPMIQNPALTVLAEGDTVQVIGQRGDWVKIEFDQGEKGWMQLQVRRSIAGDSQGRSGRIAKDGEVRSRLLPGNASGNRVFANRLSTASDVTHADIIADRPKQPATETPYRRFGYTFGAGMLASDFTYNWKFIFHQTPRVALEGSFKHAIGQSASSYIMMANLSYLLQQDKGLLPFVTGGVGVINTVPERSIDDSGISHMAINYGVGARKHLKRSLSLLLNASQYTVFLGDGIRNFREFTVGVLVGKFWDN